MNENKYNKKSVKSTLRVGLINDIVNGISKMSIFNGKFRRQGKDITESKYQTDIFSRLDGDDILKDILTKNFPLMSDAKKDSIVEDGLCYENGGSTVHHFNAFGKQHRPDGVITIDDLEIAIEVKLGNSGSSVRAGLGQSLLYSYNYDFVIFIFIDTSDINTKNSSDRLIKSSIKQDAENYIIDQLWDEFNIRFLVV